MRIYNSLTRKIENFAPVNPPKVTFYSCGPTVYDFSHLGHLRTYVNIDALRRSLEYAGFEIDHVMNITDVGHLSGDNDTGEDKLEKGAKKFGSSIEYLVQKFTDFFFYSTDAVNILRPKTVAKATDHVSQMIDLIKILEGGNFTYETDEAIYFDVTKFSSYGQLSGQKLDEKIQQARGDVYIDPNKKNPADFSLWFKRVGRFKEHTMHWDSPWGDGFPGWHIECSAMSMHYLGETIDIHTGGVDHLSVHHENEIAQSESATGKKFVKYWFHGEFLMIEGKKMSKSIGNLITIKDIEEKGYDLAALRYLFFQTHYRQLMNFTWEALDGAQSAVEKLQEATLQLQSQTQRQNLSDEKMDTVTNFSKDFQEAITNDLQMPKTLALLWEMLKSNIPSTDKLDLLYEFDQILGFGLKELKKIDIPQEVTDLSEERQRARKDSNFKRADEIRAEIEEKGYTIKDTPDGFLIKPKRP